MLGARTPSGEARSASGRPASRTARVEAVLYSSALAAAELDAVVGALVSRTSDAPRRSEHGGGAAPSEVRWLWRRAATVPKAAPRRALTAAERAAITYWRAHGTLAFHELPPELWSLLAPLAPALDSASRLLATIAERFAPLRRTAEPFEPLRRTARVWEELTTPGSLDGDRNRVLKDLTGPRWFRLLEGAGWRASLQARAPEQYTALLGLLLATWPPTTRVTEITDFLAALDRLLMAGHPTRNSMPPRGRLRAPSPSSRRTRSTRPFADCLQSGRSAQDGTPSGPGWSTRSSRRFSLRLMRVEIYRPQRIRLDRTYVKATRGWYRLTREAPPVAYRPGTILRFDPILLPLRQLYCWLRNRTRKLAIEHILTTVPRRRVTESARSGPRRSTRVDDAVHVVATRRLTPRERDTATVSAGDALEAEESLHHVLES